MLLLLSLLDKVKSISTRPDTLRDSDHLRLFFLDPSLLEYLSREGERDLDPDDEDE